MAINRRKFLKIAAVAGGTAACGVPEKAAASEGPTIGAKGYGMLNDSARCIGCKACQTACKDENGLKRESSFDDGLYDSPRELSGETYTLIKMHKDKEGDATFVKEQCMHCIDAACQSACIVGALRKQENGAVIWEDHKCIGCRYCMLACPYNIPQFEFDKALKPDIRKCTLCADTRLPEDKPTACAEVCPAGAIVFGKRDELLEIARKRIAEQPDVYLDYIYGEHEVGGSNVLYLTKKNVSFASLGLRDLDYKAPPRLTEAIQHGVFKYFIPPVAIYASLGGIMWFTNRKNKGGEEGGSNG